MDDYKARVSNLVTVKDRVFGAGDEVAIDGHAYVNCFFGACTIIYSGGDFGMANTSTDGTFSLNFRGAAARTARLMNWLRIHPDTFGPDTPDDTIQ